MKMFLWVALALAAAAVTVSATRAGLAARHDVVEVLHLSGARPGRVAGLFQNRFAVMGATAGLFGGAAAAMIALAARLIGGPGGLTPILPLAWSDALAAVPAPPPVRAAASSSDLLVIGGGILGLAHAAAAGRMLRTPCRLVELHHLPTGEVAIWEHTDDSLGRHLRRAEEIAEARAMELEAMDWGDEFPVPTEPPATTDEWARP